jgi:predicted HicB family RNase H-like nuclease
MPRGRPKRKTALMNLRVEPQVKEFAERAAERDHRSLTSFVEVLILDHCKKVGIKPNAQSQPPKEIAND